MIARAWLRSQGRSFEDDPKRSGITDAWAGSGEVVLRFDAGEVTQARGRRKSSEEVGREASGSLNQVQSWLLGSKGQCFEVRYLGCWYIRQCVVGSSNNLPYMSRAEDKNPAGSIWNLWPQRASTGGTGNIRALMVCSEIERLDGLLRRSALGAKGWSFALTLGVDSGCAWAPVWLIRYAFDGKSPKGLAQAQKRETGMLAGKAGPEEEGEETELLVAV